MKLTDKFMNNIDTEQTPMDAFRSKNGRRSEKAYAEEILEHLKQACPYGTTFTPGIPQDKKAEVEADLKRYFEIWANTWIAPLCREIIAK